MNIVDQIKEDNGFTSNPNTCQNCKYCKLDKTMDERSTGDQCFRNRDYPFRVFKDNTCNKHEAL